MSNGGRAGDSAIVTYRVLRELGRRSPPTYAAVRGDGGTVFVLGRFTTEGEGLVSVAALHSIAAAARCLAKHWHPNVTRVCHVDQSGHTLSIATDLVDGVTLDDLFELARARRVERASAIEPLVSHAILARIFLDVLAGLQALHGLRDGLSAPLGLLHGALCPANVIVGKDGVARLGAVFRPHPVTITRASEALGYAAPEALAGEVEQDARTDLFAVGVMLWEALAERRLYDDAEPARVAQRQREEELARPDARLGDVAMRAVSFDPLLRFRSAQEMATAIRTLAGTVAQGSVVAQTIIDLAGERIRGRRLELDPGIVGPGWETAPALSRFEAETPKTPAVLATMAAHEIALPRAPEPDVNRSPSAPAPSGDEDDDLPGPRSSTPDDEYLKMLAEEARESAEVLDSSDIIDVSDDAAALGVARAIAVSPRSVAPPRPSTPDTPPFYAWPVARREPSTRTPFAVDVAPLAPRVRVIPVAVIAAAALVVLVAGASIISRRSAASAPTNATFVPQTPSTEIIAPPSVDPLPPPSTSMSAVSPPRPPKRKTDPER